MDTLRWIGGMLIIGASSALSGCASGDRLGGTDRGVLFRSIAAEGIAENRYAIYVPRDLDPAAPAPAILFLHGRGECGTEGTRHLNVGLLPAVLADPGRWPFIIILPQKPDEDSTWAEHTELAMACLAATTREFRVDPSRIYLTGLSQGGAGTWAIAAEHPRMFAAIAPVCGFVHDSGGAERRFGSAAARARIAAALAGVKIPVWAFHGEKDDVIPPVHTRDMVAALREAGLGEDRLRATYFPQANHNAWDPAYRGQGAELAIWLLSHRRE